MAKIRVLFVSIYDPLKGGSGPSNHLRYLTEALRDAGCEIHVLVNGPRTETVTTNGLTMHYLKSPFLDSSGFIFSVFCIGKINEIISKYSIDIVHGQSPSSFGYASLSNKKVPFVVTLHGTSFGELVSFSNIPLNSLTLGAIRDAVFVQPLTILLTHLEYKFADKVIAVSRSIGQEAQEYYHIPEEKIAVIHNGIAKIVTQRITGKSGSHKILFVGRLVWRKGVKYIIEAMPTILKEYPDAVLQIVGSGEQQRFLMELVKDQKIERSVHFLGKVSEETLFRLYQEADICVLPSLYEPCSIALLEAMGMGKPIIASNVSGIPELIKNGTDGLLVDPSNSLQLATAVKRVFSNASLKDNLGRNAAKKVENGFTWKILAKKTLDLYRSN